MKPNIIYILADDLGYGDIKMNNPMSKIDTPNIDELCNTGMRFTDAHAASSVCTPSRYSILTGRYCWRTRLKQGIVWPWDGALIEENRKTVADLLKEGGYTTHCLGKWHLGMDWKLKNSSKHPNELIDFGIQKRQDRIEMSYDIDYSSGYKGGPVDRGFDSYFGIDVPNFPPYAWFKDDKLVDLPTTDKSDEIYGDEGPSVPDWKHEEMIPEFTKRAKELIYDNAESQNPFFLYFPLTSPHSPVVPNDQFKGKSGAGNYGDFVCEVDWIVGELTEALKESGIEDNTLVIFTSDNGPEDVTFDDIGAYKRVQDYKHYSMGQLRGIKKDVWEGGHRVPFIAKWPDVIPQNTVCNRLIGLQDFMATCSELIDIPLEEHEAEDSVSFLTLLEGEDVKVRDYTIHHSASGKFAVRKDDWVFIDDPSGGDFKEPDWYKKERGYVSHNSPGELFNLKKDISEVKNCYDEQPEIISELSDIMVRVKKDGRSNGVVINDINELTE